MNEYRLFHFDCSSWTNAFGGSCAPNEVEGLEGLSPNALAAVTSSRSASSSILMMLERVSLDDWLKASDTARS